MMLDLSAASKAFGVAHKALQAYYAELKARRAAEFEAAGGCKQCRGRAWIVVWDTMDSMSGCYAEYGGCPNRCRPGDVPYDHSYHSKYDSLQGEPAHSLTQTADEVAELERLQRAKENTETLWKIAEEQTCPRKGRTVRVVKGRKVPKGTEGEVTWTGSSEYGARIGFRDLQGKVHFTATSNVQVIALAPWEKDLAPCSCPPEDHFGWTPQRDCPEHGEK